MNEGKEKPMENRNIFSEQTITELNKSLKEERQLINEIDALCTEGYKVDDSRKHLRLFAPGRNRVVRAYILTPDHATYTKENIKKMIAGAYRPIDRREVLLSMYADWNVFLRTERIKVTRTKRWNLEFAQKEEAVRMLLEKGIQNTNDAEMYLQYIEAADKELNVIRKYAKGCVERCGVYAEEKKLYVDKVKLKRAEEMLTKAEKKQEGLKQGEQKRQDEKVRK